MRFARRLSESKLKPVPTTQSALVSGLRRSRFCGCLSGLEGDDEAGGGDGEEEQNHLEKLEGGGWETGCFVAPVAHGIDHD